MNKKQLDVLNRVHDFLGILIRENLIKDAPFLKEEPMLQVSDLADDVYDAIHDYPLLNRDVGTAYEQGERFAKYCNSQKDPISECLHCPLFGETGGYCEFVWGQMRYEEGERMS